MTPDGVGDRARDAAGLSEEERTALWKALYSTETTSGWYGQPECEEVARLMAPAVERIKADAMAEVANAFLAWADKNEIAEPPLDWAWFGEIMRRYSPLHEEYESDRAEVAR